MLDKLTCPLSPPSLALNPGSQEKEQGFMFITLVLPPRGGK